MFTVHCSQHGSEVLLSERRIRTLHHTPRGLDLEWECWCGSRGWIRTGRRLGHSARPTGVSSMI